MYFFVQGGTSFRVCLFQKVRQKRFELVQEWFCKDPSLSNSKIIHFMALCTSSPVLQFSFF